MMHSFITKRLKKLSIKQPNFQKIIPRLKNGKKKSKTGSKRSKKGIRK